MEAEGGKSLLYRLLYVIVGYFRDGGGKNQPKEKITQNSHTPVSPKPGFYCMHSKDIISNLEIPVFKAAVVSKAPTF